jgi:hypothetical protein
MSSVQANKLIGIQVAWRDVGEAPEAGEAGNSRGKDYAI